MSSIQQKITWKVYKSELDSICNKTKHIKTILLKKARVYTVLSVLINYPVKLILGTTVGGSAVQLFNEQTQGREWIGIFKMVLEIMALVLVITRDFFVFETQIEKFYAAASAVDTFYKSVKYESFLQQGSENDRLETLLMYKKLYEEMVSNNKIIQTVENVTPATPEEEYHRHRPSSEEMDDAESDKDSDDVKRVLSQRRSSKIVEDRNRAFYIHSMLERMP